MTYTNYLPALPRMYARQRISTSDCWPSDEAIMAYARAWFDYSLRPARPFPAATFCPLSAKPKSAPLRISTEQIPALSLSAWREEQQDWQTFQHAPRDVATPKPPRRIGWLERQVDKILAWQERRAKVKI